MNESLTIVVFYINKHKSQNIEHSEVLKVATKHELDCYEGEDVDYYCCYMCLNRKL